MKRNSHKKKKKKHFNENVNESDNNLQHQKDRIQQSRTQQNAINNCDDHNNNQFTNLTRTQVNNGGETRHQNN